MSADQGVSTDQGAGEFPEAVTRYLKRAAGRNLRLRAELHANLHQRMLDHLTAGLSEAQAWNAAPHDFGPPTLPWSKHLRLILALGVLGGTAFAAAAHLHLGQL